MLAHPYFARRPPKSLDRNAFRHWVAEEGQLAKKSTEDGAATLTALTAAAIAAARGAAAAAAGMLDRRRRRHAQSDPDADARGAAGAGTVETADEVGWSADALEAQAFAYLAVRSLRGYADRPFRPRPACAQPLDRRRAGAARIGNAVTPPACARS